MRVFLLPLLSASLLLAACSNVKQTLGLEKSAPDEFTVLERAPLTMPPNFNLVPPTPGAQRTQETPVAVDARGLVLGSQPTSPGASTNSAAERGLLNKAGAANASPTIRKDLNAPDKQVQNTTVSQKLGLTQGKSGKALNPATEAQRLEANKIKTSPAAKAKAKAKDDAQ